VTAPRLGASSWARAGLTALLWAGGALPAAMAADGIYTCVDAQGRKLTSDRPIPDCVTREQRLLNKDGSVRGVLPPTLSPEERAQKDAQERRVAEVRAAQADAVRRDRNLMARFPNEATHRKAREAALDTVRLATKATELRLSELARERKPLQEEAEFYKGRQLPARLKQQLDANDAGVDAQRSATANQQAELVRINKLYDDELDRLRRLWAGALPGSLGATVPATELTAAPPALRNASQ
jgi:chromosome segregation ATPase